MSFDSRVPFCQDEREDPLSVFHIQNEEFAAPESLAQQGLIYTLRRRQWQDNISELLAYIPAVFILQDPLETSDHGSLSLQSLNNSSQGYSQGYFENDYQPGTPEQQQEYGFPEIAFIHYDHNGPSSRYTISLDSASVNVYLCLECSYMTNKKFNFERHASTHMVDRTVYGCYYCAKLYSTRSNLSRHILQVIVQMSQKRKKGKRACVIVILAALRFNLALHPKAICGTIFNKSTYIHDRLAFILNSNFTNSHFEPLQSFEPLQFQKNVSGLESLLKAIFSCLTKIKKF
ncbi:C2H2-type zinc finger transcription factor [Phycomyces blakesleeanus]|uniref:C2H2-type zinc finger transcription factor n=2 Tax=Phycomyces blakesleeanus TaxID=4837 RepID=A0A167QNL7_PHYB8|nr:C2H2-type zinc finger transcription factor [Phycomyces blakesleeanus NRRL 1555(-)]OAD79970.1 C2H2-type zinc finger transcription factor [Phycomyces blakesleeanus NRRL 1555(-)]|eukprot:XP_018298010.1 C2H2-type zinc finger transcription factor [Phycomyces blakesleeanus NRRL 1555(-)]